MDKLEMIRNPQFKKALQDLLKTAQKCEELDELIIDINAKSGIYRFEASMVSTPYQSSIIRVSEGLDKPDFNQLGKL